jgi:hypothetical protein
MSGDTGHGFYIFVTLIGQIAYTTMAERSECFVELAEKD